MRCTNLDGVQPIVQVDAFTDQPFSGNPAAVCLMPAAREESWMQAVAREMNLSETAFLHPAEDGFHLRWFTPAVEVDLCGHATLASAHVLFQDGVAAPGASISFHSRSGRLSARQDGSFIELDFPATPSAPCEPPNDLATALGVTPRSIGKNRFDYLVEVDTPATVRGLAPDFGSLRKLGVRGVMVTAQAGAEDGCDFVSRFFAPGAGIDEDPVTGSAHCCLGPFWGARLGRDTLVGRQLSARGGTVRVRLQGDRVLLGGQAVTVLRGSLLH